MTTLNVWLEIYGQKKRHIIYLKAQTFLFFSESLSDIFKYIHNFTDILILYR